VPTKKKKNTRSDLLLISCVMVLCFRQCKDRQAFAAKFSCHMTKLKGLNEAMDQLVKQCKARSHIMLFPKHFAISNCVLSVLQLVLPVQ
jgi:hypothetical protein